MQERILLIRSHWFWKVVFTAGLIASWMDILGRLLLNNWNFSIFTSREIILWPVSTLLCLFAISMQLTMTNEGHYGSLVIGWGQRTFFTLFRSRTRLWKNCIVQMDFPWPFYGLNIMEGPFTMPIITRGLITNYRAACLFIHRYGQSANMDPKAAAYLKKMAEKSKGHMILKDL